MKAKIIRWMKGNSKIYNYVIYEFIKKIIAERAQCICDQKHNGSYTVATKPIIFLELHYTMTQVLIK